MICDLDHIGIAVNNIQDALLIYEKGMGFVLKDIVTIKEQGVRVAILQQGSTRIELLEPVNENSPVKNFLDKRGPGVHHLAFATNDINKDHQRMQNEGLKFTSESITEGVYGKKIIFCHPKSTQGVLIELVGK